MRKSLPLLGVLTIVVLLFVMFGCATVPTSPIPSAEVTVKLETTNGEAVMVTEPEEFPLTKEQRGGMGLGNLSQLSWTDDAQTILYVKIFSGLSVADVTRLFNDLTWLEANTDIKDVYIFINSPGGDAFSGLALSDLILSFRAKGFKIEAHANGIIASAAIPVFASCSPRYATKGTIFMVHEAALWKWPGRETSSDIRAQNELMVTLQDLYIGYLVKPTTFLTHDEWVEKEKATTWFNVTKALEWGLVDELE